MFILPRPVVALMNHVLNFWQMVRPKAIAIPTATPQPEGTTYGEQLQQIKKNSAQRTCFLAEQALFHRRLAEDYFSQVKSVEEQLGCLADLNPDLDFEHALVQSLHDRIDMLVQEGLHLEALADQKASLSDGYTKLIIELQICIYKLQQQASEEYESTGAQLLKAFLERRAPLDEEYDLFLPSQQLPAQLPVQPSPPASKAAYFV